MTVSTSKQPTTAAPTQRFSVLSRVVDPQWSALYKIAGAAAVISAVLIPIQVLVFIVWPPPSSVAGWFELLQTSPLVGLIDLDLLLVIDNLLLVPIYLALYFVLRRTSESTMLLVAVLGLLVSAMIVASNPAFGMLILSNRYAAGASAGVWSMALGAGQVLLASWEGTAFQVAYFLGAAVGIAIGIVMLRSGLFSRLTAYMAILGNAVAFGYYLPAIGIYLSVFSVLFLEIWYILVACSLFQLGSGAGKEPK
jgi:hypothetical protein